MEEENQFLVDGKNLTPAALKRKHQLENDPSCRKDPMEYLPGMEQLQSEVREKVISQMESYGPSAYTAVDVRRALCHERVTVEDLKALLSPAAEPFLEELAQRPGQLPAGILATRCICSHPCIWPTTAKTTASTAASTATIPSTGSSSPGSGWSRKCR